MSLKADTLSTRGFLARLVSPLTPTGASRAQSGKVRSSWALAGIATGSPRIPGFTLVELMVTMAIAAILLTVGVPSFQQMMRNNRAATHANEFMSALNFARSEAIKRGRRVVLCPANDGQTDCEGTDWENGWIVFVDSNNNATVDTGEAILRVHDALGGDNTLQGSTDVANYISYKPDGVAQPTDETKSIAPDTKLTFGLCVGDQKNTIEIIQTGRARVEKISCP